MLGSEPFELEDERPSYLDDLVAPSASVSKLGATKTADSNLNETQ
jgi:hypothetical protein